MYAAEEKNKNKKSLKDGPGKNWRLGQTALSVAHLAFLGTVILAQYNAGVPMTSQLLVPLIVGALTAKGLGDKVTYTIIFCAGSHNKLIAIYSQIFSYIPRYVHAYTHVRIYARICMHIQVYTRIYMHIHIHTHAYERIMHLNMPPPPSPLGHKNPNNNPSTLRPEC